MDSTTLVSFMLQTHPSVQSVYLIGSWDNFQKSYPMEKDARKGRGQWHGCYQFKDIICDGEKGSSPKRTGGLKMGHEYWYYYELDDGTETYNRSLPSTTQCPYMPGQTLNTLWVPVEVKPVHARNASTSSIASAIMTMDPNDKYITPRAPPPTPRLPRLNTSHAILEPPTTTKSISPKTPKIPSPWSPRNLFGLKTPLSASEKKERLNIRIPPQSDIGDANISSPTLLYHNEVSLNQLTRTSCSAIPGTMTSQSRTSSPSSLLTRLRSRKCSEQTLTITIPDEIAEEEEDDENFADVQVADMPTMLSPPPTAVRRVPFPILRNNRTTLPFESSSPHADKPLPLLPPYSRLGKSLSSPSIRGPARNLPDDKEEEAVEVQEIRPTLLRSHFSVDTVDCALDDASSCDSTSESDSPGMSLSHSHSFAADDGYISSDFDEEKAHEAHSPLMMDDEDSEAVPGFQYSLPLAEASELTLRKINSGESRRETFGHGGFTFELGLHDGAGDESVLGDFLGEMGYLGDAISN